MARRLIRMTAVIIGIALSIVAAAPADATSTMNRVAPANSQSTGTEARQPAEAVYSPLKKPIPEAGGIQASPCGSACEGRDPATFRIYTDPYSSYTCQDTAQTQGFVSWTNYGAELRYSYRCETAWVRSTNGAWVEARRGSGDVEVTAWNQPNVLGESTYSAMVDDSYPRVARACFYVPASGGSSMCTNWF